MEEDKIFDNLNFEIDQLINKCILLNKDELTATARVMLGRNIKIMFQNLLIKYKQLETENNRLKIYDNVEFRKCLFDSIELQKFSYENKIKEKIEELDKRIEEYEEKQKNDMFNFWHNEFLKACHYKQALQGLLREE